MLVADDHAPWRASARDVLEAANGSLALEVIAREEVDVLVLGLQMPVCDGFEVLSRLEGRRPLVIVVFGSARGSLAHVEPEFRPKVFGLLRKPVSRVALIQAVDAAIEVSQQVS